MNAGTHVDVYELLCSKLTIMIDTIEIYILILVSLILTLIQDHGDARKQKLLQQLSHKVEMDLNAIWCEVEA